MRSLVFLFRALTPVGFLLAAVAGCGGGGGGAADVAPSNARPSVAALDDRTLTAGERVDIQVSVTDANTADTHSLSASSSDTEVADGFGERHDAFGECRGGWHRHHRGNGPGQQRCRQRRV